MKTSEANIEDLKGMVVSDGTMRPEDLIPKFLNVLKVYGRDVYDKYVGENPEVLDLSGMDDETMGWVVDELFDKLNEIAPEGYSFESQDGDGACYGFWSVDADERKKCEDVSKINVGDFVEYDKNGKEDWNWAEVTGVNEDGTLNLHITDMDKTNYDDVDHVPVASCHKLPRFAGMTDTGHYYMDGPINLYKGGWEICVTKKDLDPSKYEFIGTIDSYEDMPQVGAYYDDNYVYDEDDESEVREFFGVDFPEGAVTFADFKGDVVGESCVKADGRSAESKKCEAYIQPVTLYSTTRYDDAEAVQSFLRDIGGDAVTVDKQRNGDVLSVNVSGSDDDVEAFVDTYKNEYGSIVKDCEVDATGWTAPEDIYYIATEQGRKELRGESKKGESVGETMRVDVYADRRNFDPEEFVKYVRKAGGKNGGYISVDSVVSVDVLNKANRLAQANDYKRTESKKSEDHRRKDRYGHSVRRFTAKDLSVPPDIKITKIIPPTMDDMEKCNMSKNGKLSVLFSVDGENFKLNYNPTIRGYDGMLALARENCSITNLDTGTVYDCTGAYSIPWLDNPENKFIYHQRLEPVVQAYMNPTEQMVLTQFIKPFAKDYLGVDATESKKSEADGGYAKEAELAFQVTSDKIADYFYDGAYDLDTEIRTKVYYDRKDIQYESTDNGVVAEVPMTFEAISSDIRKYARELASLANAAIDDVVGEADRELIEYGQDLSSDYSFDEVETNGETWAWKVRFIWKHTTADESKQSEADGDSALKKMQMCLKRYKDKSTGEIAADIRYDVATALDMPADEVDDAMQKFGLDNIYILRSKGMSPKVIAQKILATKNTESLDSSIDVKGRGVVELSEDDYLRLSRDINSRGYCKDKDGAYNVWIGGSFKGTFPSVEAAADAGYTLVEGKRCEETFDPSQYEYFKVWYIIDGEPYFANKTELADACDIINKVKQDGATTVELYGVNDTTETLISLDAVGCGKSESKKSESKKNEENETELSKLVKAYCLATGGEDAVPDKVEMVDKTTINDDGDVLLEFNFENEKENGTSGTTYALVCGDLYRNTDNDLLYFLHDWQSGEKVTPEDVDDHDWELANDVIKPSEILKESNKSEARPTKQEEQIKELCKLCRNDKNVAESVFKALTKDYNTSLDPVLAGQYLTATWKSKLEELGGCNGWYDGFKKLYAAMGSDFVCSVLQDLKLGSSGIGCGACITIVDTIYDKVVKRNEAKKSEVVDEEAFGKFEDAVKSILMDKYGVVDSHGPSDETANSLVLQYGVTLRDAFDKGGENGYDPTSVALLIITRQLREAPQFFDDCKDFTFNKDPKKFESLTLKQKELKDMVRYGEAEDITTISDVEAKELKKKGIETVGISRGVYGMNGALLRDSEGKKYVITARSSNLFYFV